MNIYPVIIFSKVDSINRRYLSSLRLPGNVPGIKNKEARSKFGEMLMSNRYPDTMEFLKNNKTMNYSSTNYVFSSVGIVRKKDGKVAPALKLTTDAGYVLDCSYDEFIYFIECLENISKKISI